MRVARAGRYVRRDARLSPNSRFWRVRTRFGPPATVRRCRGECRFVLAAVWRDCMRCVRGAGTSCDSWCHSPIDLMIPGACGYAGGRFIWFAGDRVRWMVDKRLNTKKASDYSEAFNSVELRGFEPLTLSMPWRCATSCAIAPMSALQTLYKIQHRAESCNSRRVGHVVEESPGRMPHRLFRSVRPIA